MVASGIQAGVGGLVMGGLVVVGFFLVGLLVTGLDGFLVIEPLDLVGVTLDGRFVGILDDVEEGLPFVVLGGVEDTELVDGC